MEEVPDEFDFEKLGRKRPEVFKSTWTEVAFIISMVTSLTMVEFFVGGFQILIPGLSEALDIPQASQSWPASVITLVAGSFLFPCGRLADMYGGYVVFHAGILWTIVWSAVTGFSPNFFMLVICRAMQGLGAAAFLPGGISLLGRTYRPGPRKNLVFSIYGAMTPTVFFAGTMLGGVVQEYLSWGWYFWIAALILTPCLCVSLLTAPRDYAEARKGGNTMDWWGIGTVIPGFMLLIYAITDSGRAGWAAPEIITTLALGVAFLAAAVFVEGWVSSSPLVPAEIFQVKDMGKMIVSIFLKCGVYAIFVFYANFYIKSVLGKDAMTAALWFTPWAVGGMIVSISGGLLLHILPGQAILLFTGITPVLAVLLFALMPDNPNYWAWVFPAVTAEGACVSVLWAVSNVFMTSNMPRRLLGLAGALVFVAAYLGSAFFLAIASVAIEIFEQKGWDVKKQDKGIFWIAFGIACVALILDFFIKLDKAGCQKEEDVQPKKLESNFDLSGSESPSVFATPVDQRSINEETVVNEEAAASEEKNEQHAIVSGKTDVKDEKAVSVHEVLRDFIR
ncbi:major facilitator superfamily transporter [Fusarium albosuccineum]|uniref:Major facilitator superfamily transporter n=1 Tax=Fusarium albosuccineum TaxID=1237068 RepID=A0A8H4LBT4_9HYPO|nr:major facilitator superfamily transporter [Fusarium albosuccineum]